MNMMKYYEQMLIKWKFDINNCISLCDLKYRQKVLA